MKKLLSLLTCGLLFSCQPEYIEPTFPQTNTISIYIEGNARLFYGIGLITKSASIKGCSTLIMEAQDGVTLFLDASDTLSVMVRKNNQLVFHQRKLFQQTEIKL